MGAGCPHTPARRKRTAARARKIYWRRNPRLGERKSRFLPQQFFPARAAVIILRAGVWGQPAPMSAIPSLPETKPAPETVQPVLCTESNIRNLLVAATLR